MSGPMAADPVARVEAYLASSPLGGGACRVVPLTPDASDRRYFRIERAGTESIVLAVYADSIDFARMPFASAASLLRAMSMPIPAVLGHSDELGIVAQQDLGDVTLQAHVAGASVSEHMRLYREAVALIVQLQARGREHASGGYVPYTLAFDVEKLTFELDFFTRHFLEGFRAISFSAAEKAALAEEWSAIATDLAAEERVLCHRDYHSRNLMLHGGRLFMVDFQDARMGPDTYDLVSLLRDSYVDLTDGEREALIGLFLESSGPADPDAFRPRFDLMSVQRTLKALGTFGFQASAKGNPAYIQYMPRTLRSARASLGKHGRFERLRTLLAVHVEELR